jgi:transposase
MEGLTLNRRDQARLKVLNIALKGECKVAEAAILMGVSERHAWRLLAAYRKEGAAALVHGNRGRKPYNTLSEEVKGKVLELAQGMYAGFNHCHFTEKLEGPEGIHLSRSTVRRILMAKGLRSPIRRRPPKHRSRRERRSQEGMLLQIDGSPHDWLQGRGPYMTLVGAIDDATGTVPYALFREQEDAQGYFLLLREIVQRKGVPLALYSDRHGIFVRSAKEKESLEEQLDGKPQPTQFGRAALELGIQSIFALSPQAKGRIERLWKTFQDRLVSELRQARACTIDDANWVLEKFLPLFNTRFGVSAAKEGLAYRKLEKGLSLDGVLCFKYQRSVAGDNAVTFYGHTLQVLPNSQRSSYAHARVEVQERLDGSLAVLYGGHVLATKEAPPHAVTLRARESKGRTGGTSPEPVSRRPDLLVKNVVGRHDRRPAKDHPWRRSLLTKSLNN